MGRLYYEAGSGDRLGFSKGSRNIMRVFRMRRTVVLCPSLLVTGLWLGLNDGPACVGDTSQSICPYIRVMQRNNIQQWWWPFDNGGARVYS